MDEKLLPSIDRNYVKSNMLIGAKYKSSLLENKIMAIALSRIQKAKIDSTGIESKMTAKELMDITGISRGSFYKELDRCAKSMTGRTIGMSYPKEKKFFYMAIITAAKYENGVLTIKFNPELKQYLTDIQRNFTPLNLKVMVSFASVYSFRLYELLKSIAFDPEEKEKRRQGREEEIKTTFVRDYSIAELKLLLGIINAELESVRRILNDVDNPDYEKAVEKSPEKVLERWSDFKRKCLDVAVKEINEVTDIHVDYVLHKSGRGGRVQNITFIVTVPQKITGNTKDADTVEIELTQEEKEEFYDYASRLLKDYALSFKDIKVLAELAEYDYDRIGNAYDVMVSQPAQVDDAMSFLYAAIRDDYEMNDAQKKRAKEKFEQTREELIEAGLTKDYSQMSIFDEN